MYRPLLILAALGVSVAASASSPQLNYILPRGGQRGTEMNVTFTGARLKDAQEVILYDKGITVADLKPTNDQAVTAHFTIAPDAALGEYRMRLRCASGISELKTFWVGPFPTTQAWAAAAPARRQQQGRGKPQAESGVAPNITWDAPQPVAMNTIVEGVIQNEQVHYFKVDVKKGQRLSAEVEGMRLGTTSRGTMFDPFLSIVEPNRFVLAESDDTPLLHQDPYLSILAPKDGTLILEVRDSSFGGSGDSHYRMHVGTFPRPAVCYPLGGKVGETLDVTFMGDPSGPIKQKITLPAKPVDELAVYAEKDGQSPPSPNYLRVSDFPNVMEGASDQNHEMAKALVAPIEPPLAFNGIIGKAEETDYYKFKGHKGQTLDVNVLARRLGSPLDSVIVVYDPQGRYLGANDDAGNPDSVLRFTPPMDGDYTVAIRDHLKAGGPEYVYRIEVSAIQPLVAVTIPNASQVNGPTQERQTIDVPRGGRYGTLIRASHQSIGGELQVIASHLPEGMTMTAVPTSADVTPVIFEAKADAPIAGRLCEFGVERVAAHSVKVAKADDKEQEPIKGEVIQQVELVIGQPNNTPYSHTTVHRFAVAVTKESAYSIDLVEPKAPLVQGGQVKLKVKATRHGDFKGPIALRMLFDPPGVSGGTVEIPADKTEIEYPLSASEGAPAKTWKIALLGEANVDGQLWTSTNLVDLHVADPFITGKIQMTAAEQGTPTQVVCDLTQANKFEGKAKLQLLGLPANSSAEPKDVTADDKKVVFDVLTTPKTNPGQTTGLFVQAALQVEGEEVMQTLAKGGVIRVDPAKTQGANKKQAVAVKQTSSDKPLSRLDKLRQEQAEAKK